MNQSIFSLSGRIRRTDYWITWISVTIIYIIIEKIIANNKSLEFLEITMIPLLWIICAQGVKRCHDLGRPGWVQIIPVYNLALFFSKGTIGENEYGQDPKESIKNRLL